eukprot:CAMPEP_0113424466 /NCGR_PEP_ID=MMETSP0013_2-20120614/29609_1 /TAXON_ID=2843 ORGANISM="Skeletonema costatum, Strain 1716" /NCGR_SAMPLE_ID=MMETSP0013_2 /ASSEMBLY_ACC=CAM_ASM_000158 /LENGTH=162 /DNA_ID=CAMNT_0000312479 /DNA_START=328 /DNA_END=813 /DNA_ORIENTATION=+ /assembly_acc=CAM_ASM_000158
MVCSGCSHVIFKREYEENLENICPFCRTHSPNSQEECHKNTLKRAEADDPIAVCEIGEMYYRAGDESAYKYFAKAAEMGDAVAHYNLSDSYRRGEGVEKDERKEIYHLEEAAIRGHPDARHDLATEEGRNGRFDRAVKHWVIAANLGHDDSIQRLKKCYTHG